MMGVFVQTNENSPKHKGILIGYVIQENGCWEWVGSTNGQGYGEAWDGRKKVYAHRMMYERAYGPIPKGMFLDHFYCSNPGCVNPGHVRPVTHRENILRGGGMAAHYASRTHCPMGHLLQGDNLVAFWVKRGARTCRICSNQKRRVTTKGAP